MKNRKKQLRLIAVVAVITIIFAADILIFDRGSKGAITTTDQVTLSLTVAQNITLNCGADVNLGTLTPGTPVTGSSTCTVTTNSEAGYDLAVRRDDADTTMDKTTSASDNITDKTVWDPTASAGAGNAAAYSGTGLGFGVLSSTGSKNTTWWGTGAACTEATQKYAGFPTAYTLIMDYDSYNSSSTNTVVCYEVDVPGTQRSGAYDGTITYQATTKP